MLTQQTQNNFPGPKSYRDFRETGPRSENGYENDMFLSEIGSGFGEPAPPPPTKNSQEYFPHPGDWIRYTELGEMTSGTTTDADETRTYAFIQAMFTLFWIAFRSDTKSNPV